MQPLRRSALVGTTVDARVVLLERLIDHAPLFPPASMALPEALEEDRRARESRAAFALGRFVCPASRLGELPGDDRELSVVLDGALEAHGTVSAVETVFHEDLGSLTGLAREVYVEVLVDEWLEGRLDAIASLGFRAKIRCGGASALRLDDLALFVRGCRERGLAFKATAGLHHAVRANGEHGLLNLLAAVVFGNEEDALREEEPDAFIVDSEAFRWRGRHVEAEEISRARRERLHAIGSCSFFEPIGELEALGILPLDAVPA